MNAFAIVNHWLHLISVVFWIGGTAFQVFVLGPFIKPEDPSWETLLKMSRRFRKFSLLSLLMLVVTGGINLGTRRAGVELIPPGYISALAVKVFLIVAMSSFLVFDLMRPASAPKEVSPDERSAFPGQGFAKLTLAVGVVVIFIASMLRQWKF